MVSPEREAGEQQSIVLDMRLPLRNVPPGVMLGGMESPHAEWFLQDFILNNSKSSSFIIKHAEYKGRAHQHFF